VGDENDNPKQRIDQIGVLVDARPIPA